MLVPSIFPPQSKFGRPARPTLHRGTMCKKDKKDKKEKKDKKDKKEKKDKKDKKDRKDKSPRTQEAQEAQVERLDLGFLHSAPCAPH